ncbi:ABC transporter substrate-binding protein [Glaciimonas sp. CA11.2]|uniref:ABC transporter substrate-binding protein n=1 Tax=unclassified Glaciimonas TaxID=2644401 RepID=UPI002AB40958|nr:MULTISPECIES: ABC transporter substrate-binding protein [unclassified Glaciimonas]MDY7545239.1 ABC transporter substrate-binding protein [Glaciimonas sp. CA11.2]MEB0011247.1 ABC transporter substrate-binding protein [Glaciimonas sp. Cout2]MEB0080897.1 ABC transporter substrate-binding protein [Glaciimonas sp. Gout2]MEB0161624.1 ABC transporter substrate-binding protein [Glaciimonas sp. CA11.2]
MSAFKSVLKPVVGIALLVGATLLPQLAMAADPIKIGAINPFSGPLALYGVEVTRGYELAVDQANAAGGVLGRKIDIVRGDASTPQQGIATVEQLVAKDKVDLFVGTYTSPVSNAASDAASRYNKLYWETGALAQNLTDRGLPNYIRMSPNGGDFALLSVTAVRELIAPALKKNLKDVKIWIEHEDSLYGTSIAQTQKRLLEALGAKVVGVGAHSMRSIDLNDTVLRAKQANPDVLIQTGYVPDGNLLLRTARDQGFKPGAIMLVGVGDTPETLQSLGAGSVEGVLVVSYPRTDISEKYGPGAKGFLAAYRAKYKTDPIASQSMTAYVGMQMLFDTIRAANSLDVAKVRAAAAAMDKPNGTYATGYGLKFDKNFQNVRALPVTAQWQAGKMVTVFPENASPTGATLKPLARN